MSTPIRVLIADDEPLARDLIARLLASETDIEIAEICATGRAAVAAITAHKPDVVFLDIRMPDLDGLSVIRELPAETVPIVILVTAFADYAVEAFEVRAFDYVLKPIGKDRFAKALRDARAAVINRRTLTSIGQSPLLDADSAATSEDRFTHLRIRAGDRILRLPVASVRFFEASSQYVQADFGAGAHLLSTESLGSLEAKLPPEAFYRIHRSYLVNATFVDGVAGNSQDGLFALLSDGRRLPFSRRSRAVAEQLMVRIGDRLDASPK